MRVRIELVRKWGRVDGESVGVRGVVGRERGNLEGDERCCGRGFEHVRMLYVAWRWLWTVCSRFEGSATSEYGRRTEVYPKMTSGFRLLYATTVPFGRHLGVFEKF